MKCQLYIYLLACSPSSQVRWDDWSRADGTKTTWENGSTLSTTPWNKLQRHLRQEKADMSLEIDVLHTTDIHNTLTHLRNQAEPEKAKRLKAEPQPNFLEEMNRNLVKHQIDLGNMPASYNLRTQRQSTRQKKSLASSSSSALLRSRSRLSMQSSIASVGSDPERSIRSTTASSSHSGRFSPSTMLRAMPSSSSASQCSNSSQSPVIRSPMKRHRKRVESPDSDTAFTPPVRPSHMNPGASQSRPATVLETPAVRSAAPSSIISNKYIS